MTTPALVLAGRACRECGAPAYRHDPADGPAFDSWCSSVCETRTRARTARTIRPRATRYEPALPTREPSRAGCCGAWTTAPDQPCTLHRQEPPQ